MGADGGAGRDPRTPSLPPDVRLALLRLRTQARTIRSRLARQASCPPKALRSWPWIRASLAHELDLAFERGLRALQALHETVFTSDEVLPVREVRLKFGAMNHCIDHILVLHGEVAAALPGDHPARPAILAIIETPLVQLAGFIEAMQDALAEPDRPPSASASEADTEIALSIDLDFAAQLACAEASAASGP